MDQLVLVEDQAFVVTVLHGDIPYANNRGFGFFFHDTRFLSYYELLINGSRPVVLTSTADQNFMGNLQLTNPEFVLPDGQIVPPHSISIRRNRFLSNGLHDRLGLFNYNSFPVTLSISILAGSDFKDMLDVRGWTRDARGELLTPTCGTGEPIADGSGGDLMLNYRGLDDVRRATLIRCVQPPGSVELVPAGTLRRSLVGPAESPPEELDHDTHAPPGVRIRYELLLEPHRPHMLTFGFEYVEANAREWERSQEANALLSREFVFDMAAARLRRDFEEWTNGNTLIRTNNQLFNQMIARSQIDLRSLLHRFPTGSYPAAGIPWYGTPFGRDGVITSLQTLILNPDFALGALRYLARFQGTRIDAFRDEEPGKMPHEIRFGEMAALGEIPHTPYYGAADTTPLFIVLFSEVMNWLDDDDLYRELLPAVMAGLTWIDRYGDRDRDHFVEYDARSRRGIRNQAWKDSDDSYQFPNGALAEAPIASIEIQGYVYDAKSRLATIARQRGDEALAERLEREAESLRERFEQVFWRGDESFYAQALDSRKQQVPTVTSNPGHCLWSGIVGLERATEVVRRMMGEDMSCGWGIRTVSSTQPSFNPMSYHNGSVWPHDNALIAAGFRRYGFSDEANSVFTSIFEACTRFRYYRLPEL